MNLHWQSYLTEMRRYLRYSFLAPAVALIPFLLNLSFWRENGGVWVGLISSLIYGSVIGVVILLWFSSIYAALTWILIRTGRFYQPPLPVQVLLGSFGAMLGMWLVAFVRSSLFGQPKAMPEFLPLLIFSGGITTAFTLFFAYKQAKEDALALRAESAEAGLHVLQQQMRPHFLFNALNSLAELIESGQENAAETTYKLSDLYRRILANSGEKTSSLTSELEIVRAYLELEQLRFGRRLTFEIHAPENACKIFLPSLMLQTLTENAVKHGIAPALEGGRVWVEVTSEGDGYRVLVSNTGAPLSPHWQPGTGIANTKARLDHLYGDTHGFAVGADARGRTQVGFQFSGRNFQNSTK